jgi:hypothetical protein
MDLMDLYTAVHGVAFYSVLISSDPAPKSSTLFVMEELIARGQNTQSQLQGAYNILIKYRDWKAARAFLKRWPDLQPNKLPRVLTLRKGRKLRYYEVFTSPSQFLVTRSFDLSRGPHIVVVAGCHVAADAIKALSAAKGVPELMKKYGITLETPQAVDFDEIKQMSTLYPAFNMVGFAVFCSVAPTSSPNVPSLDTSSSVSLPSISTP